MPGRSGAKALKRNAEAAGFCSSSPKSNSTAKLQRTASTDAFEAFIDSPRRPPPPSVVKALLPAPLSTSPPKRRIFWARSGECPPTLGMMRMLNVDARSRHRVDGNPCAELSPQLLGPVRDPAQGFTSPAVASLTNFIEYGRIYPGLGHLSAEGWPTRRWRAFRARGYAKAGLGDTRADSTAIDPKSEGYVAKINAKGQLVQQWHKPHGGYFAGQGGMLTTVDIRKLVFAPTYSRLVRNTGSFRALQRVMQSTPSTEDDCILLLTSQGPVDAPVHISVDSMRLHINNAGLPFDHAMVLGAMLCGIEPEQYTY